ncbi:MAG TPA: (E)-4-hydroxy-3-methylbut-2-enyl-diphosphate synthase [Chloroflexota bacterium]|nr:(E)-4-hydroxy-3-methylbut-2-enyl-diphosphate synthase [Chloroflexota bacterium]
MSISVELADKTEARASRVTYCPSLVSYHRRPTHVVMVGAVGVGGSQPIRVQSMTTTKTLDTEATVAQAIRLVEAGCEIVRITAPTVKAARNLGLIRDQLAARGIRVPLVADIHFSPEAALEAAKHVDKVRVNPGNYADSRQFAVREYTDGEYAAELRRIEERFAPLVETCKHRGIAMRIGTNHGSLSDRIVNRFGDTPEGMVESALEFVRICEKYHYFDVILSMKASNPKVMIAAYRLLAARMAALNMTYPFHLGVTEAGNGVDARIKSAIGIGSLLADGLGDTIRVSLAEEPEAEIPVAFALADRYSSPQPAAERREEREQQPLRLSIPSTTSERDKAPAWDPFHYSRRESEAVANGPVIIGGGNTLAVVARAGATREAATAQVLRWASPGARRLQRPDVVVWRLATEDDVAALQRLQERLASMRGLALLSEQAAAMLPRMAILAAGMEASLLQRALPWADAILLRRPNAGEAGALARAVKASGKALWLQGVVAASTGDIGTVAQDSLASMLRAVATVRAELGERFVVGVEASTAEQRITANRRLVAELAAIGCRTPLFLTSRMEPDPLVPASINLGSLLCDGLGDAVQAEMGEGGQDEVSFAFNVLQAAGSRLSKTDYVACPSCGRTLFDLQSTTERIKAKTSHLVGVKIAIMGCVVNGPGEMADADFGYVGGSPGHVNLYVGKTCVERNVGEQDADERLIALIKARGRWQEPEPEDNETAGEN